MSEYLWIVHLGLWIEGRVKYELWTVNYESWTVDSKLCFEADHCPLWEPLEGSFRLFGCFWEPLGRLCELFWSRLRASGGSLEAFWSVLEWHGVDYTILGAHIKDFGWVLGVQNRKKICFKWQQKHESFSAVIHGSFSIIFWRKWRYVRLHCISLLPCVWHALAHCNLLKTTVIYDSFWRSSCVARAFWKWIFHKNHF